MSMTTVTGCRVLRDARMRPVDPDWDPHWPLGEALDYLFGPAANTDAVHIQPAGTCVLIDCDSCQTGLEADEGRLHVPPHLVTWQLSEFDWVTVANRHYCRDCWADIVYAEAS